MRGAIILCGGRSTRMGCDKAALPFGPGETMLGRVYRQVVEIVSADSIVCVAAPGQLLPELQEGVCVVRDVLLASGPLAGLSTGLAALADRVDAVFVCGCDVPLLAPALVMRLFEQLGEHDIAAPYDGERYHPLVAVYRTHVLPDVESLLAAGERSLIALVNRSDTCCVPVESLRDVDPDLSSLSACNSPDEYSRLLRKAGFAG